MMKLSMHRLVSLLVLVIVGLAWSPAQEDDVAAGRKLFGEQKWGEAILAFTKAVKSDRSNGTAWFWLGLSRYQDGKYEGAIDALFKADALNINPAFTKYAVARVFARLDDEEAAFEWLNRAVEAGYANLSQLTGEEAFAGLRGKLDMEVIRRKVIRNGTPADYDIRYRQLDFWIGEWDVFDQNGTHVGTNTITKELGGAMLLERWTNARGSQGASINFFDPGTGRFKQQWVDQTGYNTAYEGELIDGSMVMVGVNADIKGVVTRNRMTFTPNPDGTVTQFIESYDDSTQTWNQSFLGTYKRKQATAD